MDIHLRFRETHCLLCVLSRFDGLYVTYDSFSKHSTTLPTLIRRTLKSFKISLSSILNVI